MISVHYVSWRTVRLLVTSKLISVSYVVYTGKYFFGNHVRLFVVFVAILWILVMDKVVGAQSRLLILLQSFLVNSMRVRLGRNGFLLGRCPLWVWWNECVLAAVVCAVMYRPASASDLGHSGSLLLKDWQLALHSFCEDSPQPRRPTCQWSCPFSVTASMQTMVCCEERI